MPISINVISGNKIHNTGLIRSEDLAHIAPSLSYNKRIDFSKSSMKIRGIGTLVFGEGVESSVATYIDGVLMASGATGFNDLHDVKRVELLNGPQSTLFGKNASAGLLHIITKNPNTEQFESSLELMATDDKEHKLGFFVSGPINQQFAYRLSGYTRRQEGNVENLFNDHQLNGYDTEGIRAKLQWSPNNNIDLLLSADYSKQDTDFGVRVLRQDSASIELDPAAIGLSGTPGTAGEITGISGSDINDRVNLDRDPAIDSNNSGLSLEINWRLQNHTLTSISAYRNWNQDNDRDNDQTQLPFSLAQLENRDTDWFTQEFRDASPLGEHFDYVAGLFFYHSHTSDESGDDRTFSNAPYVVEFNLADNTIKRENSAIFGQLNMHPSEALTFFVGLRYLYDKVEVELSREANTRNNPFLDDGEITSIKDETGVSNSDRTKKLTGKAGTQYQL